MVVRIVRNPAPMELECLGVFYTCKSSDLGWEVDPLYLSTSPKVPLDQSKGTLYV